MKTLYIRRHELETHYLCWEHPTDEALPKVWLDKKLPHLEDAYDAYAVQALKSVAASQSTFDLCGVRCEVAVVYRQGLLVAEVNCLGRRSL